MKHVTINDIETPFWWVFDNRSGLLTFEDEHGFKRAYAHISPSKLEGACLARTSAGREYLLWEEDEFTPAHAVIVTDYVFKCSRREEHNGWLNGLYLTLSLGQPWETDTDIPTVRLAGKSPAGLTIIDTLRLVIPLTAAGEGRFIAISEHGTRYILSGTPKDNDVRLNVFTTTM